MTITILPKPSGGDVETGGVRFDGGQFGLFVTEEDAAKFSEALMQLIQEAFYDREDIIVEPKTSLHLGMLAALLDSCLYGDLIIKDPKNDR